MYTLGKNRNMAKRDSVGGGGGQSVNVEALFTELYEK